MQTIIENEYDLLKLLEREGYKYIARDGINIRGSKLIAYKSRPKRRGTYWVNSNVEKTALISEDILSLVRDTDKEPFSISMLIKIYDKESVNSLEKVKDRLQQKFDFYSGTDEEWQIQRAKAYSEALEMLNNLGDEKHEQELYYALIKGNNVVNDKDSVYWNVDSEGELWVDNKHHDLQGYKTTKLSMSEWQSLGINKDNADFKKVDGE